MTYRITGHESFTCRYTWLPKVVRCLTRDDRLLAKEEQAMVELGVGKNMVRSIRFWAQAAGVVTSKGGNGRFRLTSFAKMLLGPSGLDPYLEDLRTLWLIHWKLATNVPNPLLAWDYLLNRWHEPELVPSTLVKALQSEADKQSNSFSSVTIAQHLDAFLHTYVPTRGRKGVVQEDNLDSPLVELALVVKVGERDLDRSTGKRETIYVFRREEKPEITPGLFLYCLNSYWQERHATEATVSLREVAYGHGSPGQVFKLPEENVRARLESIDRQSGDSFTYVESSNLQQIRRNGIQDDKGLLSAIYKTDTLND